MNTGLLTNINDGFQLVIFPQTESDGNLIQRVGVLDQITLQLMNLTDAADSFIFESLGYIICKDTMDIISPLRIPLNPINICSRSGTFAHDDDMLEIPSPGTFFG